MADLLQILVGIAFFVFLIAVADRYMSRDQPLLDRVISHWHKSLDRLQGKPSDFYEAVRREIARREIPEVEYKVLDWHERGILSDKRYYLRVRRGDHVVDICAAPYGAGFFVSYWLAGTATPIRDVLLQIPVVRVITQAFISLFLPMTYFQVDTAYMFLDAVHNAVVAVIDQMTTAQGLPMLSELDRRPVMPELYGTPINTELLQSA